jgi:hypothetical protein
MAIATGDAAVRPLQRKFRFRMVKAADIDPGARVVAGLAAQRGPVGTALGHAFVELTLVGILVASRTRAVIKVERQDLVRPSGKPHLMTIPAGDRGVRPCKHEARISVLRGRECRAMEILDRMAVLATILVRRRGELLVVGVLVAIQALRELHLVEGILTRRNVAFFAGNARVLSFQRIVRSRMFFHAEWRWFPAIYCMALGAFTLAYAGLELALVGIGRMAIRALRERQRALEIACRVAFAAAYLDVLPQQRIFCFRMIERDRHVDLFPVACGVAGFAGTLHGPLMGVCMARRASVEFESGILYGEVRTWREVTLVACDLRVHAREGIFRFRMVELLQLFPVVEIVAALTIRSELAFVRIGVAGDAVLRKTQKRGGEILALNHRSFRRSYVRGSMAFLASWAGVFIHQQITGQLMIELLQGRFPMDQREIRAIVLHVAPHAIVAIGILHPNLRVESPIACQSLSDFFVAVQTFEGRRVRPELVAARALGSATQGLMRLG